MTPAQRLLLAQCEPLTRRGYRVVPEHRFSPPRRWRIDVAILDGPTLHATAGVTPVLAVEIQGGVYIAGRHSRGAAMEKEYEKLAALAAHGYRLICATPRQVQDGTCWQWIQAALEDR